MNPYSPVDPGLHQNCQICLTITVLNSTKMYKTKFQEESVLDDGLIDGTDAVQTLVVVSCELRVLMC